MLQTLGQNNTVRRFVTLWQTVQIYWVGMSQFWVDGQSVHCDKPSKFTGSECHNFGWTDNPSTLRRNVKVVKCHSRWFVGWTNSVGRNVTWSVCGWTDRQYTVLCIVVSELWSLEPRGGRVESWGFGRQCSLAQTWSVKKGDQKIKVALTLWLKNKLKRCLFNESAWEDIFLIHFVRKA